MAEIELTTLGLFLSAAVAIVAALSYSYFISSKLPKGIYRLISLLPIFSFLIILPHLLLSSSVYATGVATFCFTWLANLKLLLFAFDHGPLHHRNSLILFITIASFPVKIKSSFTSCKFNNNFPVILVTLGLPFLSSLVCYHKHNLNPYILLMFYSFLTFLGLDFLVFVSNVVTSTVVGVELDPPSDKPYLATSLQDFWGNRWNLMVTHLLRETVYKPVKYRVFSGKDWSSLPAVLMTFLVSGLMHELFFYNVSGVSPTWEITAFFMLHGICVVVEVLVKRALAGKLELPVVVARSLTMGFVMVTSFWFFFPPVMKTGADLKAIEEFKLILDYVKFIILES